MKSGSAIVLFIAPFLVGAPAFGNTYLFSTPVNQQENSHNVDVTASIDMLNSTTMIITISNLETNPTSDDQGLNALTLSFAANLGITGITSSAQSLTINGKTAGDYSVGAAQATNWNDSFTNGATTAIALCDLNVSGCAGQGVDWNNYVLLGGADPSNNEYSNQNGSLAAHNPFLYETAVFTITGTNIPYLSTSQTLISSVSFNFGTTTGEVSTVNTPTSITTPEPGSVWNGLAGFAFLALFAIRRRQLEPAFNAGAHPA